MESKVGRMGSSFYTLFAGEDHRLAYLWERQLHTDMPNVPPRQRLELYEMWSGNLWFEMFSGLNTVVDLVERLREYVHDGDVTLRRLVRSPGSSHLRQLIFDGEQITIDTPPETTEMIEIRLGLAFPKSLVWSNLIIKERREKADAKPQG